ncbi:hypothetical protein AGDE_13487 [Angomonas deanei]|uniref:Galactose oxidase, central domain/Kelch motif containing protein, putative n=1 Tax=Angomonas deanei TaxID=59799 RepID=A0A7G2CJA2_9TRYP|nr:hypothetical protein AGDE_13487 [Angomonas deanei]CAD2219938.1 Galactose oxidase, central domain/Kelch motif containing protein, putative [Angomonas deanei]|eukprot:EPY22295.1 hypothetical protein AGDE_13487 [Angomonas deanei]
MESILLHPFKDSEFKWSSDSVCRIPENSSPCDRPTPRFGHTAVCYENDMIIFGGKDEDGFLQDLFCYNIPTRQWVSECCVEGDPVAGCPPARSGHTAVQYGEHMYVLSGGIREDGLCADDFWRLNLKTLKWEKLCDRLPFSPRRGHTSHVLLAEDTGGRTENDMMVTFGGLATVNPCKPRSADPPVQAGYVGATPFVSIPSNDILLYKFKCQKWCHLTTCGDLPPPRHFHVSQLVEKSAMLLVFGGLTNPPDVPPPDEEEETPEERARRHGVLNDFYMLNLATGMWRRVEAVTPVRPSPRMGCACVYKNGRFAVFGGGSCSFSMEGYEFDCARSTWRPFRIQCEPQCSRPTVVYACNRLLFFGGLMANGELSPLLLELPMKPLSLQNLCMLTLKREIWMQQWNTKPEPKCGPCDGNRCGSCRMLSPTSPPAVVSPGSRPFSLTPSLSRPVSVPRITPHINNVSPPRA